MALDPENLLGTPAGYASPQQLQSIYDYAKALQDQSRQPVRHWTQGVSHIVEALMGGAEARGADVASQRAREAQAQDIARMFGGGSAEDPHTGGGPAPSAPAGRSGHAISYADEPPPDTSPIRPVPVRRESDGAPDPYDDMEIPKSQIDRANSVIPDNATLNQGTIPPGVPTPGAGMPPDAITMMRALTNPTSGQAGASLPALPNNAAMAGVLGDFVRHGGDWREGLGLIGARQAFMPKYDVDPYGREMLIVPGRPPQFTGRQLRPGKETKIGDMPAYETIGPDGRPRIMMPSFGDSTTPGTPAPGGGGGGLSFPRTPQEAIEFPGRIKAAAAGATKQAEKMAETYVAKQGQIEKMAGDAQAEVPQLQLLQRVIDNPQFYSGLMSGQVAAVDMAGKALGLTSGQTASLMQMAKKLGAAGSLEQIREMGQQGAVRVPEMNMIEKSNFDPDNTPEANKAVVEMRLRLAQRSMEIAEEAQKYADAHGGYIDRGFDQLIRNKYKAQPLISDAELKKYEEYGTRKSTKDNSIAGPLYKAPPPEAVRDLVAKPTPEMRSHFDAIFGAGAADRALGGKK